MGTKWSLFSALRLLALVIPYSSNYKKTLCEVTASSISVFFYFRIIGGENTSNSIVIIKQKTKVLASNGARDIGLYHYIFGRVCDPNLVTMGS